MPEAHSYFSKSKVLEQERELIKVFITRLLKKREEGRASVCEEQGPGNRVPSRVPPLRCSKAFAERRRGEHEG